MLLLSPAPTLGAAAAPSLLLSPAPTLTVADPMLGAAAAAPSLLLRGTPAADIAGPKLSLLPLMVLHEHHTYNKALI